MAELNENKAVSAEVTKNEARLVEEMIGIDENGKIDLTKLEQRLPDLKRILTNVIVKEKLLKHPMPEQDPVVRSSNFDEVALGYDAETAIAEACVRLFVIKLFEAHPPRAEDLLHHLCFFQIEEIVL